MLPIGDTIELNVKECEAIWASVRWSLPGKAGLRFISLSAN
jgi:hypothetical protein